MIGLTLDPHHRKNNYVSRLGMRADVPAAA
jgi:hypothetical protein